MAPRFVKTFGSAGPRTKQSPHFETARPARAPSTTCRQEPSTHVTIGAFGAMHAFKDGTPFQASIMRSASAFLDAKLTRDPSAICITVPSPPWLRISTKYGRLHPVEHLLLCIEEARGSELTPLMLERGLDSNCGNFKAPGILDRIRLYHASAILRLRGKTNVSRLLKKAMLTSLAEQPQSPFILSRLYDLVYDLDAGLVEREAMRLVDH